MSATSKTISRTMLTLAAAAALAVGLAAGAHAADGQVAGVQPGVQVGTAPAGGGGTVGITFGSDEDENQTVTLSFDRSLLATSDGVRGLRREIAHAVRRACGAYFGPDEMVEERDCRDDAVADAEKQLGAIEARLETGSEVASAR